MKNVKKIHSRKRRTVPKLKIKKRVFLDEKKNKPGTEKVGTSLQVQNCKSTSKRQEVPLE